MNYYNDNDPFVCEWLNCLVQKGHLPDGSVDARSIIEVVPGDLGSFRQCHFFAGIGGWAHALELAQWPEDREIWTASLPCQPLSVAGARQGALDGRHLWPAFYRLVAVCRPPVIVGEQVASADGREWLAGVRVDLEELGYACGAANLPACSVGAPHRRERLFWCAVADAGSWSIRDDGRAAIAGAARSDQGEGNQRQWIRIDAASAGDGRCGAVADADKSGWPIGIRLAGNDGEAQRQAARQAALETGYWAGAEWRIGADGKARRVGAGLRLLVDGVPNRVGALRGFGNAIVPQVAAQFIRALM